LPAYVLLKEAGVLYTECITQLHLLYKTL